MQNKPVIKSIIDILSTIIVAVVVVFAVFLLGARLFGLQVFNVLTGSMSGTYNVGDLIYVKSVDTSEIQVGDPITFIKEDGTIVTHRVVGIDKDKQCFQTKGDVNKSYDEDPVHFKNCIGKPVFSIPLLGYVSGFIQKPPGMYIAIALGVVFAVLIFLPDSLFKKKNPAAVGGENVISETSDNGNDSGNQQ
jgi:signal peptidase